MLCLSFIAASSSGDAQVQVAHGSHEKPAGLQILQFDVGQGDAALITTPEGRHILIDAGPDQYMVADLLLNLGIDTLDLVIASHNHADHIGGMPEVFSAYVVRSYLENGFPHTTDIYQRTLTAVENEPNVRYIEATNRKINIGSVVIHVIAPPRTDLTQNDNSVGVLVEFGKFSALFTGDSEQAELTQWLDSARVHTVTVLKAAHHGSWNGATARWIQTTSPRIVLFSVGKDNRYGHPSSQVEQLWLAQRARIYRTDRDGTIELNAFASGDVKVTTHIGQQVTAP